MVGVEIQLLDGAVEEDGGKFLGFFPHLSDADFFDDTYELVPIVQVLLQGDKLVLMSLKPETNVGNFGESPRSQIDRINPIG